VIAIVGNDGSWRQITREQAEIFHDDVGTTLRHTGYHRVAQGKPVLINAIYPPTDFRKGSLSM
jgi:hypothetical protein